MNKPSTGRIRSARVYRHSDNLEQKTIIDCKQRTSDTTVSLAVVTSGEVVGVSIASVVLEAFALLRLRVVKIAVRGARAARDTPIGRQRARVG